MLALDLVGQGCGAALPNLRAAEALLRADDCKHVLSICVEVCSAAFYLDNDPGVLISACLFGDGAGAAVLAAEPAPVGRSIEWRAAGSLHNPAERDALRFEHKDGMLRNILTPQVPRLAARHAAVVLDGVLNRQGMARNDIDTWILHAGGRKVIEALRESLELSAADVGWTQPGAERIRQREQPVRVFRVAGGARRQRARRVVVDVVVRRRLQLPRRVAQGGLAAQCA